MILTTEIKKVIGNYMNLKVKQICITFCGLSLFSSPTYAEPPTANLPKATISSAPKPGAAATFKPGINKTRSYYNAKNINNSAINNSAATSENNVVLNFENADIQTVIKAISKLSGKNFVIDPRVKGTVNIVSERPISKADSYKVLESALRMQGFATVEADGVIKVLPETEARTYGMQTENQTVQRRNPGDQLVTKIFIIDSGSATQLANALRPMISPNNSISVYPSSNAIVVTDYASNMARISKIINDLKITTYNRILPVTIHLKYAYAGDVAQTLQNYLGNADNGRGGGGGNSDGAAANITVDPNTNSIIISSNVASKVQDLKALALSLDTDTGQSNNNLHVVYLKNADATHVAEVLRVIATGQDNPDMTASPANRTLSDTSSVFQNSNGSSGGSPFGSSNSGVSMVGNSKPPSSSGNRNQGNSNNPNDKNSPKILIQAEPTTNALIIEAPEAAYRNFRTIISMLDVRRVEIMIEVLVADVDTTEQGTFGIQWVGGAGNNNLGIGAISNYAGSGDGSGNSSSLGSLVANGIATINGAKGNTTQSQLPGQSGTNGISIPNEFYVGVVTGTVTVGGQQIPAISTLADMLEANNASNILARPTLLTLDNEEASIFVGQNIGIPNGSFQNSAAAPGNIATSVSRQDVGTNIRIKPLITQSGAIQLSVYEEDSKQDNTGLTPSLLATNGPNFTKRNLKTQILVDDGQIIALGGMTNDKIVLQNSGIPLLSSIPYLGWLFSWQNRQHIKTNMLIFLRPVIVRNSEGYRALTNQRYRYIMDQENTIKAKGNLLLPRIDPVNIENQVPFDNRIPPQPATTPPDNPVYDLRNSKQKNQQAQTPQAGMVATPQTITKSGPVKVQQTAPNAVIITNN